MGFLCCSMLPDMACYFYFWVVSIYLYLSQNPTKPTESSLTADSLFLIWSSNPAIQSKFYGKLKSDNLVVPYQVVLCNNIHAFFPVLKLVLVPFVVLMLQCTHSPTTFCNKTWTLSSALWTPSPCLIQSISISSVPLNSSVLLLLPFPPRPLFSLFELQPPSSLFCCNSVQNTSLDKDLCLHGPGALVPITPINPFPLWTWSNGVAFCTGNNKQDPKNALLSCVFISSLDALIYKFVKWPDIDVDVLCILQHVYHYYCIRYALLLLQTWEGIDS